MDTVLHQLFQTVSPLEVIWTVLNMAGMIRWLQRYRVLLANRADIDGDTVPIAAERRIATQRCIRALMVAVCFWAFSGLGFITLVLPPGPTTNTEGSGLGIVILMFGVPLALLVMGEIMDVIDRQVGDMLRAYVETAEAQRGE